MTDNSSRLFALEVGTEDCPAAVILEKQPEGHLAARVLGNIDHRMLVHCLKSVTRFLEENPELYHGHYDQNGNPRQ